MRAAGDIRELERDRAERSYGPERPDGGKGRCRDERSTGCYWLDRGNGGVRALRPVGSDWAGRHGWVSDL